MLLPICFTGVGVRAAVTTTGSMTSGVLQTDSSTGSSKLTEYRDFRDTFFVPQLRLDLFDTRNGGFAVGAAQNRNCVAPQEPC